MIRAALQLELTTLVRSPLRLTVLVLTLATGLFVIVQGERDVQRWQAAIDAGREKQEHSADEARALLDSGQLSPEDRPWIDLSEPLWQDWYASTRMARSPAPLAGIAFASLETAPVAVRISRLTDPFLAQGAEIENPELEAAGGLDLVTVLALLIPLLILAIGVELGGHERASGILPLIRVQSGRDRGWLLARCGAVGLLGAAVGLLLVAIASMVMSAGLGTSFVFGGLVLGYVVLWTTLLAAVALVTRNPSQQAVALGTLWIVLCILLPAVGVERSAALAAEDFALDLTVDARAEDEQLHGLEAEAVHAALFERFPELEELLPEGPPSVSYVEREGLGVIAMEERLDRREQRAEAQARLVGAMSFASPAVAFTRALEELAGRGPGAAREHRRAVVDAVAARVERHIGGTWASRTLDADDFEDLLASTPEEIPARTQRPTRELLILVAWTLALAALAGFLSRPRARLSPASRA